MLAIRFNIILLLVFSFGVKCKLQNLSKDRYLELTNIGDQLVAKNQYKEAYGKYKTALNLINTSSKDFSKTALKFWDINQKLLIFDQDSIFFDNILKVQEKTVDEYIKAHCLRAKGFLSNQELDKAKKILDKVHKISEKYKNSLFYITLSKYFAFKSNMVESTKFSFKALNIAEKENDFQMISDIYSHLSRNYLHESLYEESVNYAYKSIQIQKDKKIIKNLGQNYESLMYYYFLDSTMQDSARYYADISIHFASLANDLETQIYQYLNLASIYATIDKQKAYSYVNKLNELKKEYTIPVRILNNTDLYEGVFEMENENYQRAIEIFENLTDRYALESRSEEFLCYEYLSKSYLNLGQLDKALEMEKKRSLAKEKFENETTRKELLASELNFELLKKDRIILQNKVIILKKELDNKRWNDLYKIKETENLLLVQNKKLTDEQNKNLKTQIQLNKQKNKLAKAEHEITLYKKEKKLQTGIIISIILLLTLTSLFLYILWKKMRIQKNLENILINANHKMLNSINKISQFNSIIQFNSTKSNTDVKIIQEDFEKFEETITKIINETQNFSFKVSHEIKAPIQIIQSHLQKLSSQLNTEQLKTLQEINSLVGNIKEMGDKLLTLSKIQKFKLELKTIDVRDQVLDLLDELYSVYSKEFYIEFKNTFPIKADTFLMRLVWFNLISNCIKHHKKDIVCKIIIDSYAKENEIFYSISDNGSGIYLSKQNDKNYLTNNQSNSIGLILIQEIIKKHNGKFELLDSDENGTTFSIVLPN